jgi:ATP-binding cassette subfamily B protein
MNLLIGSGMFLLVPIIAAPRMYPAFVFVPVLSDRLLHRPVPLLSAVSARWAQKVRASFGQMNASVAETLEGLQVVKGAAQEEREQERFNQQVDEVM